MSERRVMCCMPFCPRTRGDRKGDPLPPPEALYEWLCGEHWRRIPRARRRAFMRAQRRGRVSTAPLWSRLKAAAL